MELINKLTNREKEILELLRKGFMYKEIANKLKISINTVKKYCKNIYFKLDVKSRGEAVYTVFGG